MQPKLRLPLLILAVALLALPASAAASTKSASTTLPGLPPGATGTAKAKCPHGQRATGGGFQAPAYSATAKVVVFESRKVGQRSWQVSGVENSSAPATLTVFVYCSDSAPKTKQKSMTLPVAPSGMTFTSAVASCGHAGRAQAGGFLSLLVAPSFPNVAVIIDSFRASGKSWQSRARYDGGAPTLTSYVYCADQKAPKARPGSVTSSTFGELKTALSGKCRHGTRVLAGGVSQPDATLSGAHGYYVFPWEWLRAGKSWQASAYHSGSLSTTLTSIAYCG
jgi:hypothetical protein